jgi:hypothetical protein
MFSRPALSLVLLVASGGTLSAQVNVTTYHNDTLRTGWNQNETVLTAGNVSSASFGLLSQIPLDEQVDAQPLVFNSPGLEGVYVVTANNTVYEIDAAAQTVHLSRNLGPPVPRSSLPGKCSHGSANVGIKSTPVIDAAASVMYVVTYTLESGLPVYRLHALSLPSLGDVPPPALGNVVITASHSLSDGTVEMFAPQAQHQRPALLEANGNIYAAFGSFCDMAANLSRGWVLGWATGSLTPLPANELTDAQTVAQTPPVGQHFYDYFVSAIWMSGYGIAANAAGDLFFTTSNSDTVRTNNLQESAVRLSGDLSTVLDFFTPHTFAQLDNADADFGAGGLMILPDPAAHLAIATTKAGRMYILDQTAMGGFAQPDKPHYVPINGCWCGPSYFVGADGIGRVVSSGGYAVNTWKVNTASTPALTLEAQATLPTFIQDKGFFTSVSSNGTQAGSAVIWAVSRPTSRTAPTVNLYAFNAAAAGGGLTQLFSAFAGSWPNLQGNANVVPTVANGKVYVGSYKMLSIFGPKTAATPVAALPPAPQTPALDNTPGSQIFGTITGVNGVLVDVRLRSGRTVSVDLTDAFAQFLSVIPVIGENVMVTGTVASNGSLLASTMQRAKEPETWGPDKL